MQIWNSHECYKDVGPALTNTGGKVVSFLNEQFSKYDLLKLKIKIRYVPIVMPEILRGNYPPRSKLRINEAVYVAAPQLTYDVFLPNSDEDDQIIEYLNGLFHVAPHLIKLGASSGQAKLYVDILVAARRELCISPVKKGG